MDIEKLTGYFHDGGFIGAKRKENNIELYLHSCEITDDEPVDKEILSTESMIRGKLSLIGIKWMTVDNKEDKEIPWKEYDDAEILDLEINDNKVFLLVEWINFPPKTYASDTGTIKIEAEKVYWENIPDLPGNRNFNPNAMNRYTRFLDANGVPVPKNSPKSRLYSRE